MLDVQVSQSIISSFCSPLSFLLHTQHRFNLDNWMVLTEPRMRAVFKFGGLSAYFKAFYETTRCFVMDITHAGNSTEFGTHLEYEVLQFWTCRKRTIVLFLEP